MFDLTKLSLRLRVFLFFCLLAVGGVLVVEGALYFGYQRSMADDTTNGIMMSGLLAGFGLLGLTVGIWLLFDENVAKPIERLAAEMRVRAHAGVDKAMDTHTARYLGDLAPAADAVAQKMTQSSEAFSGALAGDAARLAEEKARLTAVLTEIPVAVILVSENDNIVLYDGQAAEVLAQFGAPRLNAPVSDYLDADALATAKEELAERGRANLTLPSAHEGINFDVRFKTLGDHAGYMMVIDHETVTLAPTEARPLVYDFDLLSDQPRGVTHGKLSEMTYVVFDTETTGLLPHKDEIVQIGAVRVLRGRMVPGEGFDVLVNPGREIPPASTKVHGVSDAMVADAPDIDVAAPAFHAFARGAVIVAHNAPFDMAFLRRHGKRQELDWSHPVLDTVLLSAVLFGASETHTLDAVCERLGVVIPPKLRHTAMGDAYATAEVLCRMVPMLEARGMTTFDDVLTETKRHGRLLEDLN